VENLIHFVRDNADFKVGFLLKDRLVCERLVADLVNGIGRIGDELSQEDFFVGVERIDDQAQQLVDFGTEFEAFGFLRHFNQVVV